MKIEIEKQITQLEVIDIDFPYYYKHDLMSDNGDYVIYGKIEANKCTSIKEIKYYDGNEIYEIQKDSYSEIKNSGLSEYFDKENISNKQEFEFAKARFLAFLND